jgi:hypothetical protein
LFGVLDSVKSYGSRADDTEQFKAILAAEIIKVLDREWLTVRRRIFHASAMRTLNDSPWIG